MISEFFYWGYLHANGSLQVKRSCQEQDIEEAMKSPFILRTAGPKKIRDEVFAELMKAKKEFEERQKLKQIQEDKKFEEWKKKNPMSKSLQGNILEKLEQVCTNIDNLCNILDKLINKKKKKKE